MRKKITVVGAGHVGATIALMGAQKELGDFVLIDVAEGMPQGKALDLMEATPVLGIDVAVTGSNDYAAMAGSDVVVITAGIARKPGMSRDDLLKTNLQIIKSVCEQVVIQAPDAVVIVVTNPLDAMVYAAQKVTGFPPERVIGMAGILDTARMRYFIAEAVGASVKDVDAVVLGGHGDQMVPVMSSSTVGGVPVAEMMSAETIEQIVDRTRHGGAEIVALLKTGSAYYAPAASTVDMVEAVVRDQNRILPCAAFLKGEFGIDGIYMGVPVQLGRSGAVRVREIPLNEGDQKALSDSEAHVRALIANIDAMGVL
ncbi:MAG: malate dehydrogenase [Alphaproteobacteria bacterium CG_4_10_14_0_2_um_filter_63_37]|nr:MAG: malate dehydrogenase [Alphaproteobacteria bacterium CG_4_10_14_0_2_um_filter_63_37]